MSKYASKVVAQAKAWLGYNETDGSHKSIIDVYNSHKPLARSYPVKYTDEWCATFVSSVAIKLGYTDIMPTECGCEEMIKLYKKLGCFVEDESVTPAPGWVIFYDWQDNATGKGDNRGYTNHTGIVEKVVGNTITVIEGNYKNAVTRRNIAVNGRYIRGYGVPKYDKETAPAEKKADYTVAMRNLRRGDKGEDVRALQILLSGRGYNGNMGKPDGIFGPNTEGAVKLYQKAKGFAVDGVAGPVTMGSLLGVAAQK